MAMFGSSWLEGTESEDIGPFSHWLEDSIEEDDGPMVPSSWKEAKIERDLDKRAGPMANWAEDQGW